MSTVYRVPLIHVSQTLQISLVGVVYNFLIRWCDPVSTWLLDIADEDGVAIANGLPLITGADLLEQYAYLGIGGQLAVQTDNDTDAVPNAYNLGTQGNLYFVVT